MPHITIKIPNDEFISQVIHAVQGAPTSEIVDLICSLVEEVGGDESAGVYMKRVINMIEDYFGEVE